MKMNKALSVVLIIILIAGLSIMEYQIIDIKNQIKNLTPKKLFSPQTGKMLNLRYRVCYTEYINFQRRKLQQ